MAQVRLIDPGSASRPSPGRSSLREVRGNRALLVALDGVDGYADPEPYQAFWRALVVSAPLLATSSSTLRGTDHGASDSTPASSTRRCSATQTVGEVMASSYGAGGWYQTRGGDHTRISTPPAR